MVYEKHAKKSTSPREERLIKAEDFVNAIYEEVEDQSQISTQKPNVREETEEEFERLVDRLDLMAACMDVGARHIDGDILIPQITGKLNKEDKRSIAHEYGHYLGNEIRQNILDQLRVTENVDEKSQEDFVNFGSYLQSDYFAERFKHALSSELEVNFDYDSEQLNWRRENGTLDKDPDCYQFESYIQGPNENSLDEFFSNVKKEIYELA